MFSSGGSGYQGRFADRLYRVTPTQQEDANAKRAIQEKNRRHIETLLKNRDGDVF